MLKYAAVLFLIVPTVAVSQATPPPQAPAPTEVKKNPLDKMICKTEEIVGSRLSTHKVCATLREWKEQEEVTRDEVYRMQRNVGQTPSG